MGSIKEKEQGNEAEEEEGEAEEEGEQEKENYKEALYERLSLEVNWQFSQKKLLDVNLPFACWGPGPALLQ